ncbi:MAG: two-component system response regulator, partial [Fidelibacterota bacterium]
GYPQARSGEDIPLAARITTVADVFDALTTDRVYKQAWPLEKAYDHLREHSGSHFDPACVEAFFAVQSEIEDIQHTRPNHET